jgi:hypothetical protein
MPASPETATDNHKPPDLPESPAIDDPPQPISRPELLSRIDPADIAVDWETEAFTDEEDKKPAARWGSPPKDSFVRVHLSWSMGVYLLDCRKTGGLDSEFVLHKDVARRLVDDDLPIGSAQVYLLFDRDGGLTFWPVRMGDPGEPKDPSDYVKAAMMAIEKGRQDWVKIYWRKRKGANGWKARTARVQLGDPEFPTDPTALFLEVIADRYIRDPNDQRILKYIGEA